MKKNNKTVLLDKEASIKKSNEISLSKLNKGLTLNQMQVLAFTILSTQQNGATRFKKRDFEKQFYVEKYQTKHAYEDAKALIDLKITMYSEEHDRFMLSNVFTDITYDNGVFTFEWNPRFVPHILNLKEKYIINDLTISAQFKSSFSWTLYEHLKACFGYWHKTFTKEELMELFNVHEVKSYTRNTSVFRRRVLDVAIEEINKHTELQVHYTEVKKGQKVIGFTLHWSTGKTQTAATPEIREKIATVMDSVRIDMGEFFLIPNMEAVQNASRLFQIITAKANELKGDTTQEDAQAIYDFLKERMFELNRILVENEVEVKPSSIFYNWLDERE